MKIYITDSLFPWDRLDDSPELQVIKNFFMHLPDSDLLRALYEWRGKGRADYPIRTLWFCVILQPLLRHPTMALTLDELRRNADLRKLGDMDTASDVPKSWNISRFKTLLGKEPFRSLMKDIFDNMIKDLGQAIPDLGSHVSGDSTHLSSRKGRSRENACEIQPDGGVKKYENSDGTTVRVLKWHGYKLHLICDTQHEVALSYKVTPASTHDSPVLPDLLKGATENLPSGRIETLSYDRAVDNNKTHQLLADNNIKPIIEIRNLWKDEDERPLEGAGVKNIVYDEAGTISCYDLVNKIPVCHQMAYIGHEAKRGTLKYRCPAKHQGWLCPSDDRCNKGKKYGLTVRIKQSIDLRRFPPTPRATKTFERIYKKRSAIERVNARLKIYWGLDDGNVAGGANFIANVGLVMIVHSGLATLLAQAPRHKGTLGHTRVSTIAKSMGQAR